MGLFRLFQYTVASNGGGGCERRTDVDEARPEGRDGGLQAPHDVSHSPPIPGATRTDAPAADADDASEGTGVVVLEGELGVERVAELRDMLAEALRTYEVVRADLSGVTGCSVAALQVLWATGRTAAEQGRRVERDGERPEALQRAMDIAGLDESRRARVDGATAYCWW